MVSFSLYVHLGMSSMRLTCVQQVRCTRTCEYSVLDQAPPTFGAPSCTTTSNILPLASLRSAARVACERYKRTQPPLHAVCCRTRLSHRHVWCPAVAPLVCVCVCLCSLRLACLCSDIANQCLHASDRLDRHQVDTQNQRAHRHVLGRDLHKDIKMREASNKPRPVLPCWLSTRQSALCLPSTASYWATASGWQQGTGGSVPGRADADLQPSAWRCAQI